MANQIQPFKTSLPLYDVVTGRFCYPKPYAPGGTISADAALPRPYIVGTDVTITASGGNFVLTFTTSALLLAIAANVGDKVAFEGGQADGLWTVKSKDSSTQITCYGPGVAVTTGYIWFTKNNQKITGTDTNFTKMVLQGKHIAIIDSTLGAAYTVQVCRVASVESDTVLFVERGFLTAISGEAFLVAEGSIRGVSINCGGAGYVNGKAVASGDILTFYQDSLLEPIFGDSGSNTFKILIQK